MGMKYSKIFHLQIVLLFNKHNYLMHIYNIVLFVLRFSLYLWIYKKQKTYICIWCWSFMISKRFGPDLSMLNAFAYIRQQYTRSSLAFCRYEIYAVHFNMLNYLNWITRRELIDSHAQCPSCHANAMYFTIMPMSGTDKCSHITALKLNCNISE